MVHGRVQTRQADRQQRRAEPRDDQKFALLGTTARLVSPADGGLIGLASQNSRGFLDVTFGFPSGKTPNLDTIYDLDAEFSIDPAAGHKITLDGSQAPVLLSQSGNTYTFRYFTLGAYTSGTVTATLIAGKIGFTDGSLSTSADPLTITAPTTANVGYIDIASSRSPATSSTPLRSWMPCRNSCSRARSAACSSRPLMRRCA
jgi:hypothetical protein